MTDVLSDILDTVELKATFYFSTELHPPFGIAVPAYKRAARFHLIIRGECFVQLEDGQVVTAMPGDLVFVPNGQPHLLSSALSAECHPLNDVIAQARFEGQGPFVVGHGEPELACRMVCGHFDFAEGADHPLLSAVPQILHIAGADRMQYPLLDDILRLVSHQAFTAGAGAAASIGRLSEALFIEVMRTSVGELGGSNHIMAAVTDPHIGRALGLIHTEISRAWTVDSLACAVGMSRSRFAERFRELVGTTPMAYLAEWRLQRALNRLGRPGPSVKAIAGEVGFHSAAAFSRAFCDRFGKSPSAYRKGRLGD